jgi:predicted flap endonuclease-1-like 5' DNA nuclease
MSSSILYSDYSHDLKSTEFDEGKFMVRKRSPSDRAEKPPRIDDLKLINGVGPGVEKRLHGVGIFTFAKLAEFSPTDIAAAVADLYGMSAERIVKQDWIGQASKLAAESTVSESFKNDVEAPTVTEQNVTITAPVEPPTTSEHAPDEAPSSESPKDATPSTVDYHPATFTVELLLDEHNNVHSTHVLHVQSKREHTWMDWPKAELIDFLEQSAGVNILSVEPVLASAEEPEQSPELVAESMPSTGEAAQPELSGMLHLRDLKITGTESAGSRRILSHEQPLDAHLVLDLSEITVPGNTSLNYKAAIYGKSRNSSGQLVGEAEGNIKLADKTVIIKVTGDPLEEGIYRLAATVVLTQPGMKPIIKRGMLAVIDGGHVQIY